MKSLLANDSACLYSVFMYLLSKDFNASRSSVILCTKRAFLPKCPLRCVFSWREFVWWWGVFQVGGIITPPIILAGTSYGDFTQSETECKLQTYFCSCWAGRAEFSGVVCACISSEITSSSLVPLRSFELGSCSQGVKPLEILPLWVNAGSLTECD